LSDILYDFLCIQLSLTSSLAVCENKATGFFVIDNFVLTTADSIVYKDTSEEDCLSTCSNNRDGFGRSILCASFVYDHASFTCTIFKEKAKPEGNAEIAQAVGKRYFEKVCLGGMHSDLDWALIPVYLKIFPENVPVECADSQFIRADDSVLIGFARNVTLVETMEKCVEQCVKETDCKSAMYFYEEGECITNTESALSKPSAFAKEENEKVVYFQNGCLAKHKTEGFLHNFKIMNHNIPLTIAIFTALQKPRRSRLKATTSPLPTDVFDDSRIDEGHVEESEKADVLTTDDSGTSFTAPDLEASTAVLPSSSTYEKPADDEDNAEPTSAETTPVIFGPTAADAEHGVSNYEEDDEYVNEEDSADEVTTTQSPQKSLDLLSKKGEKASYIKYKKHPKSFASKTAKSPRKELALENEVPTEENFESGPVAGSSSAEDEGVGESLATDKDGEPVEGQTAVVEGKKHLSIKRVLENNEKEAGAEEEDYPTYFSEWSDWTPCTRAGERQIRRRKCLDLRRCLGALMQVRNCPAVIPEPVPSGPIESVRSVMDVPRIPEYDDSNDGRVEPITSQSATPSAGSVWSPWLGVCQHFASGQPCNNGEVIGFESRECIAKEPSLCEGPFFRYCTLPC
uniref:PAN domain protein n=1 Tax=Nippostrongylus brasiliensis TaxID=27835 RepID=A0A158R0D4_NIPBR